MTNMDVGGCSRAGGWGVGLLVRILSEGKEELLERCLETASGTGMGHPVEASMIGLVWTLRHVGQTGLGPAGLPCPEQMLQFILDLVKPIGLGL